jgi:serine/threonine protein phosphatase PrpC
VDDDHRFCENCGHDLWLRSGGAPRRQAGPCPGCGANGATSALGANGFGVDEAGEDYCGTCGLRRSDGTEHVEADLGRLAGVSDRGLVHVRNEDAMAVGVVAAPDGPALVAAVVCDGVSTVDAPELASRAGADAALERLLSPGGPDMRAAIGRAADAVAALADGSHGHFRNPPSCTLVAAVVEPDEEDRVTITIGWVGDSRAYWLAAPDAAEPARLLTVDHSWAVEMVAAGVLDARTALADRRAHAITRWLGAGGEPEPDVVTLSPAGPGLLLLCSDGLWNYYPRPEDLAAAALPLLARGGPGAVARELTTLALNAGGRDNVTVVAVPIGSPNESPNERRSG